MSAPEPHPLTRRRIFNAGAVLAATPMLGRGAPAAADVATAEAEGEAVFLTVVPRHRVPLED